MKALTIHQPFASLIMIGAKTEELRSWSTSHRGDLAIHAASHYTEEDEDFFYSFPIKQIFSKMGFRSFYYLPRAAVLGSVTLASVKPFDPIIDTVLSYFKKGKFRWILHHPKPFTMSTRIPEHPVPGQPGLWELPERIACRLTYDQHPFQLKLPSQSPARVS